MNSTFFIHYSISIEYLDNVTFVTTSLPIVLTLSEDREGGGVVGAALAPTLSEDLQRDTSAMCQIHFLKICFGCQDSFITNLW